MKKLEDIIERNTDEDGITIISIKDIITEIESLYIPKAEHKKIVEKLEEEINNIGLEYKDLMDRID